MQDLRKQNASICCKSPTSKPPVMIRNKDQQPVRTVIITLRIIYNVKCNQITVILYQLVIFSPSKNQIPFVSNTFKRCDRSETLKLLEHTLTAFGVLILIRLGTTMRICRPQHLADEWNSEKGHCQQYAKVKPVM